MSAAKNMASEKALSSATLECPTIDYRQPDSSPYEDLFVTLQIGRKEYSIPRCYLRAYPQFQIGSVNNPYPRLLDIDEDIGHTFVHFLYTGRYETLTSAPSKGTYDILKEFQRSIQVYSAALSYEIHGLETLAKKYIEILGRSVPIYSILHTSRTVFSKIPGDKIWI
ncbi:hypothetical protein BDV33DRAFT_84238 [Aspergillus novoparasiticus]|uniref:BTB domain-containing protein n=1 Tax=Aspergillus novoparasiticus TaxID=986946 RepID=A0A5N6E680_9EURO|nr:hypothetical protein BDV33DRAFT_84238 [Aspergillus novoparasiticus]